MRPGSHLGSSYSESEEARQAAGRSPLDHLHPEDVRRVRFSAARFREGYKQNEVDDFLDRVEEQLRGLGQGRPDRWLTAEDVIDQRFTATKFRVGYDQDEVDDFLDRIVTELRREQ